MFDNAVLNITISLVFIFSLYSLLATIVMELIASLLDFRSRMLLKSIKVMLEDRKIWSQNYNNWFVCYLVSPFERLLVSIWNSLFSIINPFPNRTLAKAFYQHPNIKYLSESIWNNRPSYISSTKFSETLTHILRGQDYNNDLNEMQVIGNTLLSTTPSINVDNRQVPIGEETLQYLRQIYYDAKGDGIKFRALLENWYSETSNRTAGWYKRQTQYYLLLLGIFIAYQFNVDTFSIYNVLVKNDTVSERMADIASKSPEKFDAIVSSLNKEKKQNSDTKQENQKEIEQSSTKYLAQTYRSLKSDADNANLVMGLGKPYKDSLDIVLNQINYRREKCMDYSDLEKTKKSLLDNIANFKYSPKQRGGFHTIAGWFITALAISLGAPFWFDLLSKLVNIRSAGKNPQESQSVNEKKDSIPEKYRVG